MKVFEPARYGRGVRLLGTGAYLPERVITNDEVVAAGCGLSVDEIVKLTGVVERRRASAQEATSDLAAHAARDALSRAGTASDAVERLIVATGSADFPVPSCAAVVHHKIGLKDAPACDVIAACSGFVYALDQASRAVVTGEDRVLTVAADIRSRFVDPQDRSTAALFGDGAGAAVLAPGEPGTGLVAIATAADGRGHKTVHLPAGGSAEPASAESVSQRRHFLKMSDGPQVYLSAVEGMLEVGERLLKHVGLGFDDVALLVPHQANRRLIERMARLGGVPLERVWMNVDRCGNMSGASTAVALHEALGSGRLVPGSRVLLVAAGAGYTAGAALLVVDEDLLAVCRASPGAA